MLRKNKTLPETTDYKLSVKSAVHCKEYDKKRDVYAIINKVTNVIEAEVDFLSMGYEAIHDLQSRLDTCRGSFNLEYINKSEKKLLN